MGAPESRSSVWGFVPFHRAGTQPDGGATEASNGIPERRPPKRHAALLTTAFRARRDPAEALHLEAALKTVPIGPKSRDGPGRQETFPPPSSNLFARLREQLDRKSTRLNSSH